MIRSILAAGTAALALTCSVPASGSVSHGATKYCWGQVTVTPSTVAIGGRLLLRGNGYTCSGPGGFLHQATVMFYQPNYGFAMFTVRPKRNGIYGRHISVPRRLRAIAVINGGANRMVPARPGRYYFWITLFDVSVVPPSRAVASVTVTASSGQG